MWAGELDGSGEVGGAGLVEGDGQRSAAGCGDGEDPVEVRVVRADGACPRLGALVRGGRPVSSGPGALAPATAEVKQVDLAGGAPDRPREALGDREVVAGLDRLGEDHVEHLQFVCGQAAAVGAGQGSQGFGDIFHRQTTVVRELLQRPNRHASP